MPIATQGLIGSNSNSDFEVRNVATNAGIAVNGNAGFKKTMSRSRHYIRSNAPYIQAEFFNGRADFAAGEVGSGGTQTLKVAVEDSQGQIIPVTFGGYPTITVANLGVSVHDPIPNPARFVGDFIYYRIYAVYTGGILYTLHRATNYGEALEYDGITTVTDKTLGGTLTGDSNGPYRPSAIFGVSDMPCVGIAGDSKSIGQGDSTSAPLVTRFNDYGEIARSVGEKLPYIYLGCGSARADFDVVTGRYEYRKQLVSKYCTDVVINYGINDVNNARTGAQCFADLTTFYGFFPGKGLFKTTVPPNSSGANWITTGAQTVDPDNPQRVILNNLIRSDGNAVPLELADVVEVRDSGLWNAFNGQQLTNDGVHPNQLGYSIIKNSRVIHAGLFR